LGAATTSTARRRADQPQPLLARLQRCQQHARDRGDGAIESQFANDAVAVGHVGGQQAHGGHHAQRDGQVEMAAFLGKVGRRHVDGDALGRERETDGRQGAAHPLAGLAHHLVGQADDVEPGQAAHHGHLHVDQLRLDAEECDGADMRGHAPPKA
jgi:hypothetical protein